MGDRARDDSQDDLLARDGAGSFGCHDYTLGNFNPNTSVEDLPASRRQCTEGNEGKNTVPGFKHVDAPQKSIFVAEMLYL